MTPTEMRIAIAEKCGFRLRINKRDSAGEPCACEWLDPSGAPFCWNDDGLPDYCSDLNAIHEAEESLSVIEFDDYIDEIHRVCQDGDFPECATALQRAEAFCRTLWPERFTS